MVSAELKKLNWAENELWEWRKGDPGKIRLARELREETTMSLKWIATRLKMGSWTYVSNLLRSEFSSKPLFKK